MDLWQLGLGVLLAVVVIIVIWGALSRRRRQESETPLEPWATPSPVPTFGEVSAPLLSEVRALLDGGNKIEAIKRLREGTGWGLKEAKDYVEGLPIMPAGLPGSMAASVPETLVPELRNQIAAGRKIEAIKRIREITGWGLVEAKAYADRLEAQGAMPGWSVPPTEAEFGPGTSFLGNAAPAARPAVSGEILPALAAKARELVTQGKKIEAVKLLRESTGWGLKEAKVWIDQLDLEVRLGALASRGASSHQREVLRYEFRTWQSGRPRAEALALLCRATGLSEPEAEAYWTWLETGGGQPPTVSAVPAPETGFESAPVVQPDSATIDQARALIAKGNKIEAIKLIRLSTGWGLKEAKDYVERL